MSYTRECEDFEAVKRAMIGRHFTSEHAQELHQLLDILTILPSSNLPTPHKNGAST